MILADYRASIAQGALRPDPAQEGAAQRLAALAEALTSYGGGFSLFRRRSDPPQGLYIWGDVGRGKSMLMEMFFTAAPVTPKRRVHFNAFMQDVHARIHAERQRSDGDPIAPVGKALAAEARLLCFDEFQVSDIADAMILGRLFDQLFASGTVVVATGNTAPDQLYEGGLNRQLFLPFIAELKQKLDIVELNGPLDYRLQRLAGFPVYLTPLGPESDAGMDAAFHRLTDCDHGEPQTLMVLGRKLVVPQAARGVARFSFADLCEKPLAAPDYLAIAQDFHTVLIDRIPALPPEKRNEARRLMLLIDTLYDEGVKLICSAAVPPEQLYSEGDGSDAFRRTVSRLAEMQSEDYLKKAHGDHRLSSPAPAGLAGEDVR